MNGCWTAGPSGVMSLSTTIADYKEQLPECLQRAGRITLASPESFTDLSSITSSVMTISQSSTCTSIAEQSPDADASAVAPILRLPPKLLIRVFSFFPPKFIVQNLRPACRYFASFSYSPELWSRLQLVVTGPHQYSAVRQLLHTVGGRLESLSLYVCRGQRLECSQLGVPHMPHVHTLNVGFNSVDLANLDWLIDACPNVRNVDLQGVKELRDNWVPLMTGNSAWHSLTHVNVSHCEQLTDAAVLCVARALPRLLHVNIDGISSITDKAVAELCGRHSEWLLELRLDGAELTDDAMAAVAQCTQLHTLVVSFAEQLTDTTLLHLRELEQLRHLHLRKGSELQADALVAFFDSNRPKRLEQLSLAECCCVNDDVVDALTKCCTRLQTLCLAWCWSITNHGFNQIIRRLNQLRFVSLEGCKMLQCAGATAAAAEAEWPAHLYLLDCRQCNRVDDQMLRELVQRQPLLTVLNYYGDLWSATSLDAAPNCMEAEQTNALKQLLADNNAACCITTL